MGFIQDMENKLKDHVDNILDDPKVRKDVIDKWNASVNIPLLNENTEEKIFSAIYDKMASVLKKVLKK